MEFIVLKHSFGIISRTSLNQFLPITIPISLPIKGHTECMITEYINQNKGVPLKILGVIMSPMHYFS